MIIWIASYPRSGNTLLRKILKESFEIDSLDEASDLMGTSREFEIEKMRKSPKTFFVKTHSCRYAEDKAIYIMRDGRRAVYSYYKWFEAHFPNEERSIMELLFGVDNYHSWSEHLAYWNKGKKENHLTLHFNKLIISDNVMLDEIGEFIKKTRICDFQNKKQAIISPFGFREGKTEWNGESEWGEMEDKFFWLLHGKMMQEMGFAPKPALDPGLEAITQEILELICPRSRKLFETRNQLQNILTQPSFAKRIKNLLKI